MRPRVLPFLLAATLLFCSAVAVEGTVGGAVAGAAPVMTKVTNFTPNVPSVSGVGGVVNFTATITGPSGKDQCTLSSSPAITGLPATNNCLPRSWRVTIPGNSTANAVTYKFTLTVVPTRYPKLSASSTTKVTASVLTGSTYVALGDSFSAGDVNQAKGWVNQAGVADGSGQATNGCNRSALSYPALTSTWLKSQKNFPPMSLRFLACSGGTTTDVSSESPSASNGLVGATGAHGEGQQLSATAQLASARIVTISAGWNDVKFSDVVKNCAVSLSLDCNAQSNDRSTSELGQNIQTLSASLFQTYRSIEAAAPNAAIYVVGYPNLFASGPVTRCQGLSDSAIAYVATMEANLNAVVSSAAAQAGVHFVDLNAGVGSFVGHDLCQSASNTWLNGVSATCPISTCGAVFHPNATGQAAIFTLLKAAITKDGSVSRYVKTTISSGDSTIAAGYNHTCAVLSSSTVRCWGLNNAGQLGNGTTADSNTPVTVATLSGATAIASGYGHTCAVLSGGTARCWGLNSASQLGNGTTTDSTTPVAVSGLEGVTAITAGFEHTCAMLASGTVKCWGANFSGQLGNGTTADFSNTPVTVTGLSGVTAISAGDYHTCALLRGGRVKCWGYLIDSQLGNGTTTDFSNTPVTVAGLSGVVALSAGRYHTCAVLLGGTVKCWGLDEQGQLGNGANTDSKTPVAVTGLSGVTAISAGDYHTCALLTGGAVQCWGYNSSGQLGNETTTSSNTPVAVTGLSGVTAISAGGLHTCATLMGKSVECWGANFAGQLGIGTTSSAGQDGSSTPVTVVGLSLRSSVS